MVYLQYGRGSLTSIPRLRAAVWARSGSCEAHLEMQARGGLVGGTTFSWLRVTALHVGRAGYQTGRHCDLGWQRQRRLLV